MSFTNETIEQDEIPQYQAIELTLLPDSARLAAIISQLFILVIALIITIIGRILNVPLFIDMLAYWIIGVLSLTLLIMAWTWFSYRYKGYALREHDIIYQRGVIWRKVTILPFNRVQHVETQQGILQRYFDLTTLNLFTAGGMRADLAIHGMDVHITDGIKSMLLSRIQVEQQSDD